MVDNNNIFKPGENCWVSSKANFVAPLIDCGNYYKALHSAIVKAKHSIFIIGWDIDSLIFCCNDRNCLVVVVLVVSTGRRGFL